jgi:16S rRNA (guanine527-N7)-methyltransferase
MALTALGSGWHERIRKVLGETLAEPERVQKLSSYLDLVVAWNAKLDLTAARTEDELCDLFVADAALIARHSTDTGSWVDVGSGAGAPGLPLSILLPGTEWTLVEPQQKRVAFLRTVIGTLGSNQVRVQRARSDALGDASFDVAVSRATLSPEEWSSEARRIARQSFWVLLARADIPSHDGALLELDESYAWPLTGALRRALRFGAKKP